MEYIINECILNIFSASPVYATVSEDFKHKQVQFSYYELNVGGREYFWGRYRFTLQK